MPRKPKPRDDYSQDVATINRIKALVAMDERIASDRRERVVTNLTSVIEDLLQVDLNDLKRNGSKEEAQES